MQMNCPYSLLSGLWGNNKISLLAFAIAVVVSACTSTQSEMQVQSPSVSAEASSGTTAAAETDDAAALNDATHPSAASPQQQVQSGGGAAFEKAVMTAANAAELAKVAQTAQEWALVAQSWQDAIALIQTIPATDEKFAIAQQRLPDYQQQLQAAQQRAAQLAQKQALQHKQRAKSGEQIFQDVNGSYQLANVLQGTTVLQVIIVDEQWKSLSKPEQVDLAEYAQALVQAARSAPEQYVDVSSSSPIYDRFVSKAAGLCDDCWQITVGERPSLSSFSELKTVVQGDELWEQEDPCCRGKKVSEFVN